jgi:3'-5' exoribonuclease
LSGTPDTHNFFISMARLPRIADLETTSAGWGFFLCSRKDLRTGRSGDFLSVVLQDASGEIRAKVFQDVDTIKLEFDAGEFVKVQGRGNAYNGRLELVIDKIRRILADRDAADGFKEQDCIPCAPRPAEEMWEELLGRIAGVEHPALRMLLSDLVNRHAERLKIWPAARQVHHAYRSGLLEHILKLIEVGSFLSACYGARRDLVVAGAILHDLGKLEELSYEFAADYTVAGNLVGHIAIGLGMLRDGLRGLPDFPPGLALELEHLVLSHHGAKELGSPVEPMTIEAFILATVDDLDAKIQQIRRHIADDESDGPFTSYHRRLERVFLKPQSS